MLEIVDVKRGGNRCGSTKRGGNKCGSSKRGGNKCGSSKRGGNRCGAIKRGGGIPSLNEAIGRINDPHTAITSSRLLGGKSRKKILKGKKNRRLRKTHKRNK